MSKQKLAELYKKATALGLEVLVEVHDKEELRIAEALSAQLIGVNNRNLKTFDVSIGVSQTLGEKQKTDTVYISESGFSTSEQVALVKENYRVVLVGEGLMRETDPKAKVKALQVLR